MSKEKQISLCITTFNRYEFTIECFAQVIYDERIKEIIISDDCSTDGSYERLKEFYSGNPKVKLFQNSQNVGVYQNKKNAIELSNSRWAILFDSDNIISLLYLDIFFSLHEWHWDVAYCPDMASPALNYTHFGGIKITKENAGNYIDQINGQSLFNTMNGVYNVSYYLSIFKNGETPIAADSILINWLYLMSGGAMYIVPGLSYFHRIHLGSHYVNFTHKSDEYHKQITDKIRLMK